jgi:hypothetical protein
MIACATGAVRLHRLHYRDEAAASAAAAVLAWRGAVVDRDGTVVRAVCCDPELVPAVSAALGARGAPIAETCRVLGRWTTVGELSVGALACTAEGAGTVEAIERVPPSRTARRVALGGTWHAMDARERILVLEEVPDADTLAAVVRAAWGCG